MELADKNPDASGKEKLVLSSILLLNRSGRIEKKLLQRWVTSTMYMYRELCIRFGSEALTPRLGVLPIDFVSELDIHSILGLVKAIMVNKGRYGRTRAISLQIPEACVEAVVLEDYTLNALSTVCYGQKRHNR